MKSDIYELELRKLQAELVAVQEWVKNRGQRVVIVALAIFTFGLKIFGGGLTSAYWTSGLNGFLILLGSALLADNSFTLGAMAGRVWQIVLATAYVSFVLAVLAMFQDRFARTVVPLN